MKVYIRIYLVYIYYISICTYIFGKYLLYKYIYTIITGLTIKVSVKRTKITVNCYSALLLQPGTRAINVVTRNYACCLLYLLYIYCMFIHTFKMT